jgi:phasin family protein
MAIGTRKSAVKAPAKIEPPVPSAVPVKAATAPKAVAAKTKPGAKAPAVSAPVTPAPIVAKPVKAKPAPKVPALKPAAPVAVAVKPVEAPVVPAPNVAPPKPVAAELSAPIPVEPKPVPTKPIAVVETLIAAVKAPSHEEISAFGKANVDAIVHANKVLAQGVEALSREVMSATQASFGAAQAAAKALIGAKTLADVVELNRKFTKASFERFVGDTTRISELSAKLAQEALAPIASRVTHVVEQVTHR